VFGEHLSDGLEPIQQTREKLTLAGRIRLLALLGVEVVEILKQLGRGDDVQRFLARGPIETEPIRLGREPGPPNSG
jgi:hypothetical protein